MAGTKGSSTCNPCTTLSWSAPRERFSLAVSNSRRIGARHSPADPAAEAAEIPPSGHSAVGKPPPFGSKWGGRSGWGGGSERKWIGGPPKSSSPDGGRWWLGPLRAGRSYRGQQPLLPPLCGSFLLPEKKGFEIFFLIKNAKVRSETWINKKIVTLENLSKANER